MPASCTFITNGWHLKKRTQWSDDKEWSNDLLDYCLAECADVLRRSPTGQPHDVATISRHRPATVITDRQTQPPRSATKPPVRDILWRRFRIGAVTLPAPSQVAVDPKDKPCTRLMPSRWSNHVHRLARRFQNPESARADPRAPECVHKAQEFSKPKLKRLTREALLEWFNQSERLWIARTHYHLRGPRFIDFAERIGVDQSSAYQLVEPIPYKARIVARCEDEGRYYGWETCLYSLRETTAWATSGSRCQARIWHATCDFPTVRHALHPRCLCDCRKGAVRRLHPEGQEWVDAGMARRRVAQSAVCWHLSVGGKGHHVCAGRRHRDRLAAGLVRCAAVSRLHAVRQDHPAARQTELRRPEWVCAVPLDDRGMRSADGETEAGQAVGCRAGHWSVHRWRL